MSHVGERGRFIPEGRVIILRYVQFGRWSLNRATEKDSPDSRESNRHADTLAVSTFQTASRNLNKPHSGRNQVLLLLMMPVMTAHTTHGYRCSYVDSALDFSNRMYLFVARSFSYCTINTIYYFTSRFDLLPYQLALNDPLYPRDRSAKQTAAKSGGRRGGGVGRLNETGWTKVRHAAIQRCPGGTESKVDSYTVQSR